MNIGLELVQAAGKQDKSYYVYTKADKIRIDDEDERKLILDHFENNERAYLVVNRHGEFQGYDAVEWKRKTDDIFRKMRREHTELSEHR